MGKSSSKSSNPQTTTQSQTVSSGGGITLGSGTTGATVNVIDEGATAAALNASVQDTQTALVTNAALSTAAIQAVGAANASANDLAASVVRSNADVTGHALDNVTALAEFTTGTLANGVANALDTVAGTQAQYTASLNQLTSQIAAVAANQNPNLATAASTAIPPAVATVSPLTPTSGAGTTSAAIPLAIVAAGLILLYKLKGI